MITVVVPTLNSETTLAASLSALVPAVVDGFVREVIIADGGSRDRTLRIADQAGATIVRAPRGRGSQIVAGAAKARGQWIMILHSDTVLAPGWSRDAATFMEKVDTGRRPAGAAAFRFALDDEGIAPRIVETLVALRANILKRPYGDQGLLLPLALYKDLGGFQKMPILEDLDFVRRLGGRRVSMLRSAAVTSPDRYIAEGYLRRVLRNQYCLLMYALGRSVEQIYDVYHSSQTVESTDDFLPPVLPVKGEEDRG